MKLARRRRLCAPILALLVMGLLAGCGGGGGGGSSSPTGGGGGNTGGTPQPSTASITGVLQDKATSTLLPGRTVTVQGTSLAGVTDGNGAFSIGNVPTSSVVLVIVDAAGVSNGTYSVDIGALSGSPRNLGTIQLAVSAGGLSPPGAPPITPHSITPR